MGRKRRRTSILKRPMTTFCLSFIDPQAWSDKIFLGVAICDMDESEGAVSIDRVLGPRTLVQAKAVRELNRVSFA